MKFTYLLIDFFTVIVPLLFSFHPKIQFNKQWLKFFLANVVVTLLFIAWDAYFTSKGVWSFNDRYVTGITFLNLPLEEILFFICIPFACVFTYHALTRFYSLGWSNKNETWFCIALSIALLTLGIIHNDRMYTSWTFISTALLCLALKFVFRSEWLSKAFTVYAVLLIPFFIVNGILTGTGLEEPVVLYNNNENLGIRIATIPVEDIFYGLELILLNIFLLELQQKRSKSSRSVSSTNSKKKIAERLVN